MRAHALIQARMGSKRLPGKVLRMVEGKPLLSYMLDRLKYSQKLSSMVLLSSTEKENDALEIFALDYGISCCRGPENDVLERYALASKAMSLKDDEWIVRLTGDCPLLDPRIMDRLLAIAESGEYDYLANTAPPPGFYPDGMDVEIFSVKNLKRAAHEAILPSEREHVTFYFWKNPEIFRLYLDKIESDFSNYRFTVDYFEDFEYFGKIVRDLLQKNPLASMKELIEWADTHPEESQYQGTLLKNAGWMESLLCDQRMKGNG